MAGEVARGLRTATDGLSSTLLAGSPSCAPSTTSPSISGHRKMSTRQVRSTWRPLVDLCQARKIATVIDRRYPLSEVPEALRYLGEGHAKGKIAVILD